MKDKTIQIRYFALLREERGLENETLTTQAQTAGELYEQLKERFRFSLSAQVLRVAVNESFKPWNTPLLNNDTVVFIPPVAGG